MTTWNGMSQTLNANMSETLSCKKIGGGWQVSVHGEGYDPFYDVGGVHTSPAASFTATFNVNGTNVGGSVKYRQFPSIEIYAYNSKYSGGHKFLFGYQPSGAVQHTTGVMTLMQGEKYQARF